MERLWVVILAVLLGVFPAAAGCGRSSSDLPPEDESEGGTEASAPAAAPKPSAAPVKTAPGKTAEPAGQEAPKPEEPPHVAVRESVRLFNEAAVLKEQAQEAWRKFRDDGENKADWEKAKELIDKALANCDTIQEKDPSFERVHDFMQTCATFRRTLLEMKPDE